MCTKIKPRQDITYNIICRRCYNECDPLNLKMSGRKSTQAKLASYLTRSLNMRSSELTAFIIASGKSKS